MHVQINSIKVIIVVSKKLIGPFLKVSYTRKIRVWHMLACLTIDCAPASNQVGDYYQFRALKMMIIKGTDNKSILKIGFNMNHIWHRIK